MDQRRAYLSVALGVTLATFGLYLIFPPLALLFGGAALTANGLLINIDKDEDA